MSPSWPNFQHILTEAQYFMGQTQGLEKATFLCDETLQRAFVRSLEINGGMRLAFCPVIDFYSL